MNSYGGYSKKGYAPYNPKKKNQDALVRVYTCRRGDDVEKHARRPTVPSPVPSPPFHAHARPTVLQVMAEDPKTRSLVLCVMDGHGEDGDKVRECVSALSSSPSAPGPGTRSTVR